jgi:hypothetical protein
MRKKEQSIDHNGGGMYSRGNEGLMPRVTQPDHTHRRNGTQAARQG